MPKTEQKICFVGVGGTTPTRRIERPEVDLAVEACRMAAEDFLHSLADAPAQRLPRQGAVRLARLANLALAPAALPLCP